MMMHNVATSIFIAATALVAGDTVRLGVSKAIDMQTPPIIEGSAIAPETVTAGETVCARSDRTP